MSDTSYRSPDGRSQEGRHGPDVGAGPDVDVAQERPHPAVGAVAGSAGDLAARHLHGEIDPDPDATPSRAGAWARLRRHRPAVVAAGFLAVLALAVIVVPLLLGDDRARIDPAVRDQAPSWSYPMGTDELGRDQLLRILEGGQLTLSVAASAVAASMVVGVLAGLVAGYVGGFVGSTIMRVADVFYSLPGLFVVILLVTLLGAGFWTVVIAIGIFGWMSTARLVRASTLSIKERDYITAARAGGIGELRIAVRHVLPNTAGPVIVTATLGVAIAIIVESTLSFLGLGFSPPRATWGGMLEKAQTAVLIDGHWWLGLFPGLMILSTVLAVSTIGDALDDTLGEGVRT
ncbi:MAG: ABC transporter permease [Actinomycetota bacterium]|nr:ABC transporter permease [Actinomycetota bacterium]